MYNFIRLKGSVHNNPFRKLVLRSVLVQKRQKIEKFLTIRYNVRNIEHGCEIWPIGTVDMQELDVI